MQEAGGAWWASGSVWQCMQWRSDAQVTERGLVAVHSIRAGHVGSHLLGECSVLVAAEKYVCQPCSLLHAQVVEAAVRAVRHLRSLGCVDIEFSPEDAGRSDPKFLYRILGEVIQAGATTLNIPDTTGESPCPLFILAVGLCRMSAVERILPHKLCWTSCRWHITNIAAAPLRATAFPENCSCCNL